MNEQNAPTCQHCAEPLVRFAPDDPGYVAHTYSQCISFLASENRTLTARLASLEAVVKQMGPQGAPTAEPARVEFTKAEATALAEAFDAEISVPTDEPARCEPWCGKRGESPLRPSYVSDLVWCSKACHEAQRPLNPAPESTPDVPGPTANAEPERCSAVTGVTFDPTCAHCLRNHKQPIPPRPEAQGTVTHDDARRAVNELRSFHGASTGPMPKEFALLDRYRTEQAAREQAQAAEIAGLRATNTNLVASNESMRAGYVKACAELAALKRPVPSQADGTGNRERAEALWYEIDSLCGSLAEKDAIVRALDAAEQRGRASRDGVVSAGAVELIRSWLTRTPYGREAVIFRLNHIDSEAARLLRALASDAGKDGGR